MFHECSTPGLCGGCRWCQYLAPLSDRGFSFLFANRCVVFCENTGVGNAGKLWNMCEIVKCYFCKRLREHGSWVYCCFQFPYLSAVFDFVRIRAWWHPILLQLHPALSMHWLCFYLSVYSLCNGLLPFSKHFAPLLISVRSSWIASQKISRLGGPKHYLVSDFFPQTMHFPGNDMKGFFATPLFWGSFSLSAGERGCTTGQPQLGWMFSPGPFAERSQDT